MTQRKLEEKTAELEREKEATRALSEKLQRNQYENNIFDVVMSRNKEILENLDKQNAAARENIREAAVETQVK